MSWWSPISKAMFVKIILLFYVYEFVYAGKGTKVLHALMPSVQPLENGTYLCTAFKAPEDDVENIIRLDHKVNLETIHHILLFGCIHPGHEGGKTPGYVWHCKTTLPSSREFSPCQSESGSQIIYSWAEGSRPIDLPDGVGFKIGKSTGINYMVLQIHYSNTNPYIGGETDSSGVNLDIVPSWDPTITKSAGILVLFTGGTIPAHEKVHIEVACRIDEQIKIHPVAFQPHTHRLGKVVAGYKIDRKQKWHLIGKKDPQEPQMFYPVEDKNMIIGKGDVVAARCTTENFLDYDVNVGPRKVDEMCDFYMLYYAEGNKSLDIHHCTSRGPPHYYWRQDKTVGFVPPYVDIDASSL